jgi:hypothetical protein
MRDEMKLIKRLSPRAWIALTVVFASAANGVAPSIEIATDGPSTPPGRRRKALKGKLVDWLEKVSDEQYSGGSNDFTMR